MNSILLYIDPEEAERQQMIQMAADLVEALTFQFEGLRLPPQSIGVIAEPSACLEIGLSMLGRGETRTVEGGERRASPLRLFPFISDRRRENGEMGLIKREETELGDFFGMLDDLAVFGAIEQDPELSWKEQPIRSAIEILEKILRYQSWQSIVFFASDNALSQIQGGIHNDETRIVNARLLEMDEEQMFALLGRLESTENEETHNIRWEDKEAHQIRREAVINALRLEALLSHLEVID